MKKSIITFLMLLCITGPLTTDTFAQSKNKGQSTKPISQNTFRVYAVLKIISKNRMSLDFGQKAEGGYFYGQINDILLDSDGKDYTIKNENEWIKLINDLSRLGWKTSCGVVDRNAFLTNVLFYKDVNNKDEIIEGLRFKNP